MKRLIYECVVFLFRMNVDDILSYSSVENEECNNKFEIKASFDTGWQKRGTGYSCNSLSGNLLVE